MNHRALQFPCQILFLFILWFSPAVFSRQSSPCDSLLNAAWEKFSLAYFEEARALAASCLEQNTPGREDTLQVYLLFALIAFQQNEDRAQAEQHIKNLLAIEPGYELQRKTPKGFGKFFEEIKEDIQKSSPSPQAPQSAAKTDTSEVRPESPGQPSLPEKLALDSFLIFPETNILDWLTINVGMGSNFGDSSGQNPPLLANFRLGLDIAELEFQTIEIVNRSPQQRTQLPTLALKIRILPEKNLPGLALIARTSVQLGKDDYPKGLKSFTILASKTFDPLQVQAGISYLKLNASLMDSATSKIDTSSSPLTFLAAAQLRLSSIAMLLLSFDMIPEYFYFYSNSQLQTPETRYSLALTIRPLLLPWFTVDVGGKWYLKKKYQPEKVTGEDLLGNDIRIQIAFQVGFSLSRIFSKPARL